MSEAILDARYWSRRLREAKSTHLHHAVFKTSLEQWEKIEARHREILARHIQFADSILDAGCGWGRLLDLLPQTWGGRYLGIDLSPDFISMAIARYGTEGRGIFLQGDLRKLPIDVPHESNRLDWAVLCSIRPMIRRHLGENEWKRAEAELRRVARRILYLEYDPDCNGFVE